MIKKNAIILLLALAAPYSGWPQGVTPTGLAFAQAPETECPPECVTDSLEIITYYPSPYGYYEELRGDKIIVGDSDASSIPENGLPPSGTLTFEPLSDDPDASDGNIYEGSLYYQGAIGGTPGKFRFYNGLDWQDLDGGEMKVPNTTASCDTANSGMLAFDGAALKLCVNSSWQAIYSPKILGSLHTEYDCISIPGANVVSDSSGNKFCRMSASSCPSGWTSYLNWSETMNKTCSQYCCCNSVSGASSTNYCSTGGHAWSNNGRENCHMWGVTGLCPDVDCNAEIVKIGCY